MNLRKIWQIYYQEYQFFIWKWVCLTDKIQNHKVQIDMTLKDVHCSQFSLDSNNFKSTKNININHTMYILFLPALLRYHLQIESMYIYCKMWSYAHM